MKKMLLLVFMLASYTASADEQFTETKAIDALFKQWEQPNMPGAALGVIKDGKLVYAKGYGLADLEHDVQITPSSVFYIGSVSKQFVTFSLLLLEEQGKIDLDDKIQKYLPDFPEYNSPLTIRHFIHHTSGVRDYLSLMALKGRSYLDNADVDEVYDLIKNQKELNFQPGEKYMYSNSCYFMLAMIVEKASGQSMKSFAAEHIFKPLGMKSTLFHDDNKDLIKNRVFSYEKKTGGTGFNNLISRFDLVGSGGVYTSIEDLFLWDQNFYNNKLGKGGQDLINKMHQEGQLNNGTSSGYAFALMNGKYKGMKTVHHSGSLAGYRSQLMRFPDEKVSVIILANRGDANPTRLTYQVADIVLKEQFVKEVKEEVENTEVFASWPLKISDQPGVKIEKGQITGNYELRQGMILSVTLQEDKLNVLQSWNQSTYNLERTQGNTFEIPNDDAIQFTFSEISDNSTQLLTVFQNGRDSFWKRNKSKETSSLNLASYAGKYYSEELDASYLISVSGDNKLNVKIGSHQSYQLFPYDTDTFTAEGILMRFDNVNGMIEGFVLDGGRVKNLRFTKK